MTAGDAAERMHHARDVLRLLFPGATVRDAAHAKADGDPRRTFAVAPSAGHPRLLVPLAPRGAAATALRAYGGRLNRRARWGYQVATGTARLTGTAMFRDRIAVTGANHGHGIDEVVSNHVGVGITVAAHLTPARANRKPILQALAAGRNEPVGFVKVAADPLTRRLVEDEADVLRTLAVTTRPGIVFPRVVALTEDAGRSILTLTALPTWRRGRTPDFETVRRAAGEISGTGAVVALPDSTFWTRLVADLGQLPGDAPVTRMADLAEDLARWCDGWALKFAPAHGDFSPWNMWQTGRELLIWDWERFSQDAPFGSDLVHYRLQELLVRLGAEPLTAARTVVTESPELLRGLVPSDAAASRVALLHLLALAVRYEKDGQAAAGTALGRTADWLLPAVEASITQPHGA